jgi:DNA-binding MarR family transcriptional regulator
MARRQDRQEAPGEAAELLPHPAPAYLFHLFIAIDRLRDARLDKALRPLGLNVSRHRAIAVIALLEPCTMSELADLSVVDRTTMTRVVDQLVARGLAGRTTPSEDRRQVLISLTDDGREVYGLALKIVADINKTALAGVSDQVIRDFARVEQSILTNLASNAALARRLLAFRRD